MKRWVILMMVLGLVFGSLATAEAAKKKKPKKVERTVELAYQTGSPGIPGLIGACMAVLGVEGTACIDIPTGGSEVFVTVEAKDASGLNPSGILAQDTDSTTPGFEIFATFCGSTTEPVAITPGLALRVSLYTLPSPTCPGATTTGNITTVLSNLP